MRSHSRNGQAQTPPWLPCPNDPRHELDGGDIAGNAAEQRSRQLSTPARVSRLHPDRRNVTCRSHKPQRTQRHKSRSSPRARSDETLGRHQTVSSPHGAHSNLVVSIVLPSFLTRNPSGNLSTRRVPSDTVSGRSSSDTSAAPFAPHAGHHRAMVQLSRVSIAIVWHTDCGIA